MKMSQDEISILAGLAHAPAHYDSHTRSFASSCFEGTRVALLRQIDSWVKDTRSSSTRVYWLSGLAGIGKTTISQTLAKRYDM